MNQTIGIFTRVYLFWKLSITLYLDHIYNMVLNFGGQGNCVNQNNIQNLQNRALRKITFKKFHDPINPLYKDLKILKFKDLLHLQDCLLVLEIEKNQALAKSFVTLKHCGDKNNCQIWASTKRIHSSYTPLYKTNTYGNHSAKYHCILDWNQFKRIFPNLWSSKMAIYSKFRSLIKRYFLNKY